MTIPQRNPSGLSSKIGLQLTEKAENDAARFKVFSSAGFLHFPLRLKRRLSDNKKDCSMISISRGAALLPFLTVATLAAVTPAFSQAPTEPQREAIKSECRSDYMAHCSSIPPGGAASLECLQKNMSSLAPGCASAVRAVEAPAAQQPPRAAVVVRLPRGA